MLTTSTAYIATRVSGRAQTLNRTYRRLSNPGRVCALTLVLFPCGPPGPRCTGLQLQGRQTVSSHCWSWAWTATCETPRRARPWPTPCTAATRPASDSSPRRAGECTSGRWFSSSQRCTKSVTTVELADVQSHHYLNIVFAIVQQRVTCSRLRGAK